MPDIEVRKAPYLAFICQARLDLAMEKAGKWHKGPIIKDWEIFECPHTPNDGIEKGRPNKRVLSSHASETSSVEENGCASVVPMVMNEQFQLRMKTGHTFQV